MSIIFETKNFLVTSPSKPHIDRKDGGHIIITPKKPVANRQELTPKQAIELMRLTIIAGEAMYDVMNEHGVDIGRINYQDNGNWSVFSPQGPKLHVHLYGRAKNAKVQKYGQACFFPHINEKPEFYESFEPLKKEDILAINKRIKELLKQDKFKDNYWAL